MSIIYGKPIGGGSRKITTLTSPVIKTKATVDGSNIKVEWLPIEDESIELLDNYTVVCKKGSMPEDPKDGLVITIDKNGESTNYLPLFNYGDKCENNGGNWIDKTFNDASDLAEYKVIYEGEYMIPNVYTATGNMVGMLLYKENPINLDNYNLIKVKGFNHIGSEATSFWLSANPPLDVNFSPEISIALDKTGFMVEKEYTYLTYNITNLTGNYYLGFTLLSEDEDTGYNSIEISSIKLFAEPKGVIK